MRNTITPFLSYNSIGHVIYEMSSGHVLSGVVLTEEEYERVEYDEVKELRRNSEILEVSSKHRYTEDCDESCAALILNPFTQWCMESIS